MNAVILIFLISLNAPCFGAGAMQNQAHERYTRDMSEITRYYYRDISVQNNRTHIKDYNTATRIVFTEIKNGLYILTQNDYRMICYDINNTRPAASEIRFMEIVNILDFDYEINNSGENIEILTSRQKPVYDGGYIHFIKESIRAVFEFDANARIKYYKIINQNDNRVEEEYSFYYNAADELRGIYSVNNGDYVLCKSIYYDGQLRLLERPFFNNSAGTNIDEIIIFNGNTMKYHSKRYLRPPHVEGPPVSDDFLTQEEAWYSVLTEFNAKGFRIRQTHYFHYGAELEYEFKYLRYDAKNNWTYSQTISEDSRTKNINEYKREIKYKE
ncbi:MAG: hypothetical protein LBK13_07940 [Spirochaetales bacterium]|jgi:hypothetical protein|nr:hypothetical protein [Spirochaetales bacterium]